MNKSRQWLCEAKQLCAELGPEDGVDPRTLLRSFDRKTKNFKSMQMCKEVKRSLSLVLAGELNDPVFQNLDVIEVSASKDGQFLLVLLMYSAEHLVENEKQLLDKLNVIEGYLRSEIAWAIKRKRVPMLKFKLISAAGEVNSYACSENN